MEKMRIALVVQARMGSSRFPRKALALLGGRPSLAWCLIRLKKFSGLKILVTSDTSADAALADLAQDFGFIPLRGSEKDVLSRFAAVVRFWEPEAVIRITGDCPLIDFFLVKRALEEYNKRKPAYLRLEVVDGFDVSIIESKTLLEANSNARLPSEREHVVPYILRFHPDKCHVLTFSEKVPPYHLSLDYPEDLSLLEEILQAFSFRENFSYEEVLNLLDVRDDLREKALRRKPNEGFFKSIEQDKIYLRQTVTPIKWPKTEKWFKKTKNIIPLASQTFSKSYYLYGKNISPLVVIQAKECYLWDLESRRYVDYTMGLGACLLGYAEENINSAVAKQIQKGVVYSLPHILEQEVAEKLIDIIPSAEMVRFGKNGSDVTTAAIRLARAYTGRDFVVCCGYHGWHDWYIGITNRHAGVPENVRNLTLKFSYNNLSELETLFDCFSGKIAAVIMEPVILEEPKPGFLESVKELCEKNGTILIFDEVLTGFRFGLSGAQGYYNVVPHLSCFGKALGNGFPISALVGKKEIMKLLEKDVFFSFTFGGECASLAAANACLQILKDFDVINHIHSLGNYLMLNLKTMVSNLGLQDVIKILGFPCRFILSFSSLDKWKIFSFFQQEATRRGELFSGAFNLSWAHNIDIVNQTLDKYYEIFQFLRYVLDYELLDDLVHGEFIQPIFELRKFDAYKR